MESGAGIARRVFAHVDGLNEFARLCANGMIKRKISAMTYRSLDAMRSIFAAIMPIGMIVISATQLSAETLPVPAPIAVRGEQPVVVLHAEGAEIYECEADEHKRLAWRSREPIATLSLDGDTVGRHYAGLRWGHVDGSRLRWEHVDGSVVQAKIVASAAGAYPNDIPWLRMDVVSQTGSGAFYGVSAVQRINTRGGMAAGACGPAGSFLSVPYSADYVFWRED
jgi:Protein of unknown function (DUF3455)